MWPGIAVDILAADGATIGDVFDAQLSELRDGDEEADGLRCERAYAGVALFARPAQPPWGGFLRFLGHSLAIESGDLLINSSFWAGCLCEKRDRHKRRSLIHS